MKNRILVIICTASGSQIDISHELEKLLKTHQEVHYRILHIKIPPHLSKAIKKIRISKYDSVVVYGGDGTIVAAFKEFQDRKQPILVLPGGTANEMANYFGMPDNPLQCLELYLKNSFVINRVDVASVNGNPLVLDLHMGLWTEAIKKTSRNFKKRVGRVAYGWSALRVAPKAPIQNYEFKIDNNPVRKVKGYTFLVVNQGKHEILGQPLFPYDQAPGMVQVAIVKSIAPHRLLLWYLFKFFTYGRNLNSVIEVHKAKQLRILKAPRKILADDTEQKLSLPIDISGSHYGVRVIMPPTNLNTSLVVQSRRRFQLWLLRNWHRIRVFTNLGPSLRYSHVAPGIYVGGKVSSSGYKTFEKWGITGIVSMRTTRPPVTPDSMETLWLPTKDWTPPKLSDLKKGVAFIQKHIDNNGSAYIHCQLGEGRGPSMAAAYLISKGFTVSEAIALIIKYRPIAKPNAQQIKRLAEWQESYNTTE